MKKLTWAFFALVALAAQPLMAGSFGSLADVIANGNSITFGDKTFSNFTLATLTGPNLGNGVSNAPTAADIAVSVTNIGTTYNLLFSGFSLTADGFGAGDVGQADMTLTFDVTAAAPNLIDAIDVMIVSGSLGGNSTGSGHALVDETATYTGGSTLLHAELGGGNVMAAVSPASSTLHIIKDANLLAVGDTHVQISAILQSFHQADTGVPEIDANVFGSALTLLFGCVAVMLGRRKMTPVVG